MRGFFTWRRIDRCCGRTACSDRAILAEIDDLLRGT
jgi:hypothetical protein